MGGFDEVELPNFWGTTSPLVHPNCIFFNSNKLCPFIQEESAHYFGEEG